jgi:hypothetical protein
MRTLIYPEFPLVNETGARWSLRHNALWFLSGFYAQDIRGAGDIIAPHSLATMSPLERTFFDEIVEDLCANPPALLAVELPRAHAPGGRGALDLLAYYGQDPRIAQLVGGYREVATVPPFSVLTPAGQPSCR